MSDNLLEYDDVLLGDKRVFIQDGGLYTGEIIGGRGLIYKIEVELMNDLGKKVFHVHVNQIVNSSCHPENVIEELKYSFYLTEPTVGEK